MALNNKETVLKKKNSNSKSTNDDTAAGTLRKRTKRAVENEELLGTVTSGNIPEESLDLDNIWDNPESKALEDSIRKESQITEKILNNSVFQQDSDQRNSTTTPNPLPRRTQNANNRNQQTFSFCKWIKELDSIPLGKLHVTQKHLHAFVWLRFFT
jgi:hypothetical protein